MCAPHGAPLEYPNVKEALNFNVNVNDERLVVVER